MALQSVEINDIYNLLIPFGIAYKTATYEGWTVPKNHLRKLPREIRQHIFSYVLEWSGKTPALIKALRVDPIIHADAIYALNKRCTFKLNFASITLISEMRDSIWDKIENLSVRFWSPSPFPFFFIQKCLRPNKRLKSLNFDLCGFGFGIEDRSFASTAQYCITHCATIREFSVTYWLESPESTLLLKQTEAIDKALGVKHGCETVRKPNWDRRLRCQCRIWKADNGKNLSWDQAAYRSILKWGQ